MLLKKKFTLSQFAIILMVLFWSGVESYPLPHSTTQYHITSEDPSALVTSALVTSAPKKKSISRKFWIVVRFQLNAHIKACLEIWIQPVPVHKNMPIIDPITYYLLSYKRTLRIRITAQISSAWRTHVEFIPTNNHFYNIGLLCFCLESMWA